MSAFGDTGAKPVTITTADAAAQTLPGRLVALHVILNGAAQTPTVTVYDSASAAGTVAVGPVKAVSGINTLYTFGDEGINLGIGAFVHADSWTSLTVVAYVKQ